MVAGLTEAGEDLADRHVGWFRERTVSAASGSLSTVAPDVIRAALRATRGGESPAPELTDREWRLVAGAAYGPGLFQVRPAPFRRIAVAGLCDPEVELSSQVERLLVAVVLQGRPANAIAGTMGYHSPGECLRAVGATMATLADHYGRPRRPRGARAVRLSQAF
jgi:Predicted P-loop ATPase fused to an acetyltransferase